MLQTRWFSAVNRSLNAVVFWDATLCMLVGMPAADVWMEPTFRIEAVTSNKLVIEFRRKLLPLSQE